MFFDTSDSSINSFFEKKFKYSKSSEWVLPSAADLLHDNGPEDEIDSLQKLKLHLNSVKSKLNDYPIESWSAHTRRRNPAGQITWKIKNEIKAEFVTQAWCKFYECIHNFSLVSGPEFNSLHLCEAPGAFIAALNHYVQSTFPSKEIKWNWLSTSLNPYHESNPLNNMVTDDRFILHTFDQWVFGEDFTGNIVHKGNIENIAMESKKMGRVDLITADGSIDCMECPESQEEIVSFLHFSEISAALSILSENGSFVMKMFTLFDMASVGMIYLLNCVFREVNVFKPATSKCGNSEVYIVCVGFDKKTKYFDECINLMLSQLKGRLEKLPPLFRKSFIPMQFLIQHEVCARMFMHYQINVIESNIFYYENPSEHDMQQCKLIRQQISDSYMTKYKIKFIPEENSILYNKHAQIQYEYHSRDYQGSYTERCYLNMLSSNEKFKVLKKSFKDIRSLIDLPQCQIPKKFEILNEEFINLKYYFGKPVEKLHSSLFVNKHFMYLRNKLEIIFPNLCKNIPKVIDSCCELVSSTNLQDTLVILNFDAGLSSLEYGLKEKEFFTKLLKSININSDVEKVIFRNYAFLTHFSVSFLKVLSMNYFQEINIRYDNCTIELKKRKKESVESANEININNLNDSLFCLIDIKELHKNEYNQAVTNFNNVIFIKFFDLIFSDQIL